MPGPTKFIPDRRLEFFITDSNRCEGVERPPTIPEYRGLQLFLSHHHLTERRITRFAQSIIQPRRRSAHLRVRLEDTVMTGNMTYDPPPGGSHLLEHYAKLLIGITRRRHPYWTHVAFMRLSPYTDANGRTGRAIWLWQMQHQMREFNRAATLGFTQCFYYQCLEQRKEAEEYGRQIEREFAEQLEKIHAERANQNRTITTDDDGDPDSDTDSEA